MHQNNNETFILFLNTLQSFKFIVTNSLLSILVLVLILLNLDNKYESISILHPAEKQSNLASMASEFSGLAAMAGVTVPGSDEISISEVALEVLKSKDWCQKIASKL